MDKEWCHDCAEGWDYHRSLGVALCPLHKAAPALLEALEQAVKIGDEWPMTRGYRKEIWDKARAAIAQAKGEPNG